MKKIILEKGLEYYKNETKDHGEEHIRKVMTNLNKLMLMAEEDGYRFNRELMLTAAIYHDAGRTVDDELHHIHSANIVRNEEYLKDIFTEYEIETIAIMCAEHRSSNKKECMDLMSALLNDADSINDIEEIIERTYLYQKKRFENGDDEFIFEETYKKIEEKYGENGYQKFRTKYARKLINEKEIEQLISMKGEFHKLYNKVVNNIK